MMKCFTESSTISSRVRAFPSPPLFVYRALPMLKNQLPFLFGAQYYRAPTPERECWPDDLRRMRELGFNQVKYWVQWRWQHRGPDRFYWDDLDQLMDLAAANSIGVALN